MSAFSLFLAGFVSLVGQVVLLREIHVAFYGVELIYLIALGAWLLFSALGALSGGKRPSPGWIAFFFLLFALSTPLALVFLRASRILFGGVPGAFLPFPRQMAALAISLAPVACLSGLLFRSAAGLYAERGRTLAGAYGIESAGALAGGLLATVFLRVGIQNFPLALGCGLVSAAAALLLFRGKGLLARRSAAALSAALLLALLWQGAPLDRAMTACNHPDLLAARDTPYGRVAVSRHSGQISVFSNDALAFETEGTEAEVFSHLAALQHAAPRRILLLGGALDGTLRELLRHRPERIDAVEIDRTQVALVRPHLPAPLRDALSHPAVHLILADPRRFLKESGSFYDLIIVNMPEPSSGQANRFYTREFFGGCAARLRAGGILALRLRTAENFWTEQLVRRTASIHRALASVFPEVLFLPGEAATISASFNPLPRSAEILGKRLLEREIHARQISPQHLGYLFTDGRVTGMERRLKEETVAMNTDLRPVSYSYAALIWLSQFYPKLSRAELPGFGGGDRPPGRLWWTAAFALALLLLLGRLRVSWRRWLLVATAGFGGAVLESVLLLAYQAKEGVLYQDIGFLLMAFMGGLALGAWILNEAIRWTGLRQRNTRRWGGGLLAAWALFGLAVLGSVGSDGFSGIAATAILLLAAGFLVAGILAFASLYNVRDQKQVIGPLYAADLLGGCLGSLLGSLLLIPMLGLDGTALGTILLTSLAVLLI
jgi:spermidine synthase